MKKIILSVFCLLALISCTKQPLNAARTSNVEDTTNYTAQRCFTCTVSDSVRDNNGVYNWAWSYDSVICNNAANDSLVIRFMALPQFHDTNTSIQWNINFQRCNCH